MNEFKDILKYLRKREGISQAELALRLNISPSAIGNYESGTRMPTTEIEEALADYFNVSLDFLRGIDSERKDHVYYTNPESAAIAQEIFDDPDLHALFDAARNSKPESLKAAAAMLKALKGTNPDG